MANERIEIDWEQELKKSVAGFNRLRAENHFQPINLSRAYLREANLSGADLRRADLRRANLSRAYLSGANLSEARLSHANLSEARLSHANMSGADLRGADLSEADLPFVPAIKNLFTEILQIIQSGEGQLKMSWWHTCETTHCMAGWAIHLAGDAGRVAESFSGSEYAGALIINASCPYLNGIVPDFHSDDETAMKFIEECAEKEAALNN